MVMKKVSTESIQLLAKKWRKCFEKTARYGRRIRRSDKTKAEDRLKAHAKTARSYMKSLEEKRK